MREFAENVRRDLLVANRDDPITRPQQRGGALPHERNRQRRLPIFHVRRRITDPIPGIIVWGFAPPIYVLSVRAGNRPPDHAGNPAAALLQPARLNF